MTHDPDHEPCAATAASEHRREELGAFTFLVAITVHGPDRVSAERALHQVLPCPEREIGALVECWWIAEDDRCDGSDNDSAVFVTPGNQHQGRALLRAHALTR